MLATRARPQARRRAFTKARQNPAAIQGRPFDLRLSPATNAHAMHQESQPAPLHQRLLSRVLAPAPWQWLFLLLICVISFLALTPVPPKDLDTGWDKANHFLAFGSLAFVGRLAWPRAHLLTLPLGLVAYGAAIELIQYFVPGRSCEWADLFADSLGIALGWLIVTTLLKLLNHAGWGRVDAH